MAYRKIKDNIDLKELERLGFKPDGRKDVIYSLADELFGDVVLVSTSRRLYCYEASDGIMFKLMALGLVEIVEESNA